MPNNTVDKTSKTDSAFLKYTGVILNNLTSNLFRLQNEAKLKVIGNILKFVPQNYHLLTQVSE